MIYLVAATAYHSARRFLDATNEQLGLMMTPASGRRFGLLEEFSRWAADTGCYSKPERFDLDGYLAWLSDLRPVAPRRLFATAPDVWGNASLTLERSMPVLPRIRDLGYRAALVAQDGLAPDLVDWDAIDVLFVGGTDRWRRSAGLHALLDEARLRGKWTHLGRCNSRRRLIGASVIGYDSADGTHVAHGPDKRMPEVLRWLAEVRCQPALL